MDNKVFVTGATGLLGSHLICYLLQTGHSVYALKRSGSNLSGVREVFEFYLGGKELWKEVRWVEGDVLKPETLVESVQSVSQVYHCAAMVSFQAEDRVLLKKTNLEGTKNVAALCLKERKRLCYVSSIAALGDATHVGEWIDEETPEVEGREHSLYSRSKGKAEKIIWEYVKNGLDAVIVCPSVILGAGHWNRSSAQLYFMAAKGMFAYTCGVTGYVDVRDVVRLMVLLAEDERVKGERFILNGGNYSFRELFGVIAEVNGKGGPKFCLRPWMTKFLAWVVCIAGKLTGRKFAFSKEIANSSQHCSYYSNLKVLSFYPEFRFYTLKETINEIKTHVA